MPDDEFSLAACRRAATEDRLEAWVTDFLASPGSDNVPLAAALALGGTTYVGPIHFALDRLTPMAGPDDHEVVVPVDEAEWEEEIGDMEESLDEGWEPPPVLISHHDGAFFVEDGNHRCESLRRRGATHAWAILLFSDPAERAEFLASHEASELDVNISD